MKKNLWRGLLPLWLSAGLLAAWCHALAQSSAPDFSVSRFGQLAQVFFLPLGIFFFSYALQRLTNLGIRWRIPWKIPRIVLGVLSGLVMLIFLYLAVQNALLPSLPLPSFLAKLKPFQLVWILAKLRTLPGLAAVFFCALGWELAFPLKFPEGE